jgi:hypothetical protein
MSNRTCPERESGDHPIKGAVKRVMKSGASGSFIYTSGVIPAQGEKPIMARVSRLFALLIVT